MFTIHRLTGLTVAVALALPLAVGCAKKDDDRPKAPAIAPGQTQGTTTAGGGPTGTASVTGKISFKGTAPKPGSLKMEADPVCAKAHTTAVPAEEVLVNADGTLQNVLVYVKSGATGTYAPPSSPAVVDQRGCLYVPHVQGMVAGQKLDILNSDPTLHNVQATAAVNAGFNEAMPLPDTKIEKTFDQPEATPVKLKCQVHPWMTAHIGVFSHPFFAVTGSNGAFEIKNLPAGTYTIAAWHEKFGEITQDVTVTDGQAATADFDLGG